MHMNISCVRIGAYFDIKYINIKCFFHWILCFSKSNLAVSLVCMPGTVWSDNFTGFEYTNVITMVYLT